MKVNLYVEVTYKELLRDIIVSEEDIKELEENLGKQVPEKSECYDWLCRRCKEEDGCFQGFKILGIDGA